MTGRRSGGGSWLLGLALIGAALYMRSGGQAGRPARATTAVPAAVPAPAPARPPQPTGFARYDWPRGGTEGKVELAANLAARNFYVVLDGSGSMADKKCSGNVSKMEAAKQALAEFSKSVPADAQLGLTAFDGGGTSERVALAVGNRDAFMAAVRAVNANGGTPLKSAISIGIAKLEEAARRQLGYGEYTLVVVTDGEASVGEDPVEVVGDILGRSPVAVHTIGFCIGTNHSLNQPGRTLYKSAQSPEELRAGLGAVLAEAESFDAAKFAAPK